MTARKNLNVQPGADYTGAVSAQSITPMRQDKAQFLLIDDSGFAVATANYPARTLKTCTLVVEFF